MYYFHSTNILKTYENKASFNIEVLRVLNSFKLSGLSLDYINNLLNNNNKLLFGCFDNKFDINNCPVILIYNKTINKTTNQINYYIFLLCTKFKFRNLGYASLLLNGFVEFIKNTKMNDSECKIIVSSVEEAVIFYEKYGFKWTRENLNCHKQLIMNEKYIKEKEYFILELKID
jgi:ribosomal protein S18 acetylase RimI-like enzyme